MRPIVNLVFVCRTLKPSIRTSASSAGVLEDLAGCHTTPVGDYVIEGHVPLADIQRLLSEKPVILGIAVPGMPMGSPGMEMGESRDAYDVVAFTTDGSRRVFARYEAKSQTTAASLILTRPHFPVIG